MKFAILGLILSCCAAFAQAPTSAKVCMVSSSGAVSITITCDGAKVQSYARAKTGDEGMTEALGTLLSQGFTIKACPTAASCILTK